MVTALGVASVERMFCVSNILPLADISIDPLSDLTHLLSIVNSTSSSSFPCERKWMQSQQVDSPVKRDTLQESVLSGGFCKPASTFCYRACNRFDFLHVLPAIILASHTSNVIPVILADSYFRPCRPNVIHSAGPLVVAPPFCSHRFTPHCFTGHLQSPFPSSPTSSQHSPLILSMSEAGFRWCIQIILPLSQPSPTACADGAGGTLIWWHTWAYEVQGVLEGVLWFGGVCTLSLIACSVFIFVFVIPFPWDFLPPSQVLVHLPSSCWPIVWVLRKIQDRANLSKTGIISNQHSLK